MNINYDDIIKRMEEERREAEGKALTARQQIAVKALELGISKITISFAGSGDSGSIESIWMHRPDENWKDLKPADFRQEVEDFAYDYLSGTGIDWYNNDGGQGEIEFDFTAVPMVFKANVDVNIIETRTEHWVEEFL